MAIVFYYDEKFFTKMLCNRAMVHLKMRNYYLCYIDASEALKLDDKLSKAWYRKGKSLAELGYYDLASDCYTECLKLELTGPSMNQVQSDAQAIAYKLDKPQIDQNSLDNYDPLESDPSNFSRELFTGELNRTFIFNEPFEEERKSNPNMRPPSKYDSKTWKSCEQLLEILFERAIEERKLRCFDGAIYLLNFIQALDFDFYVHFLSPLYPNPSLGMLQAECYLQAGKYHKGILLAAITGTKYTQVINKKGGWDFYGQNMDEIWIFYNSLVCQTMVRWGAYKSGCYAQAKRLMSPMHDQIVTSRLPPDDKLLKIWEGLKIEVEEKKENECNDQKVVEFLDSYISSPQFSMDFEHYDDNSMHTRLAKKLFLAGKTAWFILFPDEYVINEAKLEAAKMKD
uniref:Uncharacterized protein n=1 Tax=Acrobeloides nanus TaxID=290746 RepID=A0A914ELN6_9BILA